MRCAPASACLSVQKHSLIAVSVVSVRASISARPRFPSYGRAPAPLAATTIGSRIAPRSSTFDQRSAPYHPYSYPSDADGAYMASMPTLKDTLARLADLDLTLAETMSSSGRPGSAHGHSTHQRLSSGILRSVYTLRLAVCTLCGLASP